MESRLVVNLDALSRTVNAGIVVGIPVFFAFGHYVSFYFHFLTVAFILLALLNLFYKHVQKPHTLLANYGLIAQFRYLTESVGPELRQYLFSGDTEERPFTRIDRSEVYRKAKNVDSSSAFGSVRDLPHEPLLLRHSLFPVKREEIVPFSLTFGEERGLEKRHTMHSPILISAMSYGALGKRAVMALSRGARKAGILLNTGEGGFPKYHLQEGADLIFQMGTAKFGVRTESGELDEKKLTEVASLGAVKMIEIKFSQGAKPGKGGLLPQEKISPEIASLRGISPTQDFLSPSSHAECVDAASSAAFVKRVQDLSQLPVGVKMCLGREEEFVQLIDAFMEQDRFPDYLVIDGAEGGTGAAPKSFMDDLGVPIFSALPFVQNHLQQKGVRNRLKLIASGKLINPGSQIRALCLGADAVYTARGFMLALGCIQALQCNSNSCPTGIATHNPHLEHGLDVVDKAQRVYYYVKNLEKDLYEICAAMGHKDLKELSAEDLFQKQEERSCTK